MSEKKRLPRGWHRWDIVWCADCTAKHFIRRAIVIPIARPLDSTWEHVRELLAAAWRESTALANWTVMKLAQADVVRKPGDEKMPPMASVNLYKLFNADPYDNRAWWTGGTQSANAIMQGVERKYRATRFQTIWRRERALPTYRYPMPYPIDADAWHVTMDEHKQIALYVALPGGRVSFRLRRDPGFWRQVQAVEHLIAGRAKKCECALYRVRIGGNSGQVVTDTKGIRYRVMAKMTMWVPRTAHREPEVDRQLRLSTSADAFWRAEIPGRSDPWVLNLDQVRRAIQAHETFRQRMSEDLKHEKRWPKRSRRRMVDALALRCEKQNNRLRTAQQQAVAMVAGLASRARVQTVVYNDSERSFVDPFPWASLREMLRVKLDEHGIALVHRGPADEAEEQTVVEE